MKSTTPNSQQSERIPVALVIGASRGIGRQIAIDLALGGYNVILSARTLTSPTAATDPFPPDPTSPACTAATVEREIRELRAADERALRIGDKGLGHEKADSSGRCRVGNALAIAADVRDAAQTEALVRTAVTAFDGQNKKVPHLDVLVYAAGAVWWAPVMGTPMRRFRLMQQVNVEGLYASVLAALPYFRIPQTGDNAGAGSRARAGDPTAGAAIAGDANTATETINADAGKSPETKDLSNPGSKSVRGQSDSDHVTASAPSLSPPRPASLTTDPTAAMYAGRIIVVSPPIYSRFFRGKTAYAVGKVGMSVLTRGLAMDIEQQGWRDVAITSLWPAVGIESAATRAPTAANPDLVRDLRKPTIFSHATLALLRAPAPTVNGRLLLDEDVLVELAGATHADLAAYSVVPGVTSPRRMIPPTNLLPVLEVADPREQADRGLRVDSRALRGKL